MAAPLARLLVVLILVAGPAVAQETTPVLLQRTDGGDLEADVGQPATATFHLFSLNPADDFLVSVQVDAPRHWRANASQDSFFLGPRNQTDVHIRIEPTDTPRGPATIVVRFTLIHDRTGEVTRISESVDVASGAAPRVVGLVPNPLPPPLDNEYGTFALDMAFWVVLGIASVLAGDSIVRLLTTRAKDATTREIVQKLRKPVFLLVLLLGLSRSFAILPRNAITVFVAKFLIAIAVTVFGLYVLYRALDAGLVYYQREIAPRTATKVDDVLVPAFRKVGLVLLYVAGIILTLRNLGWDPTLVFAGAGIAGLVIAFAAQDTFSNLFSGIFLMLDRPFVEGDVILLETGEVARVESIGLRTTDLYEYDHHHVITVPNNQLATKRIINYSAPDSLFRVDIFIGVGYAAASEHVTRVLRDVAMEHPEVVHEDPWAPVVQLRDFADSSMTFMLRVTLRDPRDRNRVPSNLRMEIKRRFDAEGIEIPFPQRVIHVRDAEGVRPMNQNR